MYYWYDVARVLYQLYYFYERGVSQHMKKNISYETLVNRTPWWWCFKRFFNGVKGVKRRIRNRKYVSGLEGFYYNRELQKISACLDYSKRLNKEDI